MEGEERSQSGEELKGRREEEEGYVEQKMF